MQPVCMLLQQRSTFCTIDNDRVENVEVGLRADLFLVPENETETTKVCEALQILEFTSRLEPQTS